MPLHDNAKIKPEVHDEDSAGLRKKAEEILQESPPLSNDSWTSWSCPTFKMLLSGSGPKMSFLKVGLEE